jgi:hypothetical protein
MSVEIKSCYTEPNTHITRLKWTPQTTNWVHDSYKIKPNQSKSFRTGRLEREIQMAQLSTTRCTCFAILWVSLMNFAAIALWWWQQRVIIPKVSVYFVLYSVRKVLDTPSYKAARTCTAGLQRVIKVITTEGAQPTSLKRNQSTNTIKQSPPWHADSRSVRQKLPAVFINVFTTAYHRSLFWKRRIQSTASQTIYLASILILSSHLRLSIVSGFPTKLSHAFLTSPVHAELPVLRLTRSVSYP